MNSNRKIVGSEVSDSKNELLLDGASVGSEGVSPISVLFIASNPRGTEQLRLDGEIREIKQALRQSALHDKFILEQEWAVRVSDLQGHLLRHQPDIVHFSGHGSTESEILLEDDSGDLHPVPSDAFAKLFQVLKDNVKCVVLNACYSEKQAEGVAQNIDYVVGMSRAISDSASVSFAAAFYQALGFGRDIKTAFELGCLQIDMENIGEQDTPQLLINNTIIKAERKPKKRIFLSYKRDHEPDEPLALRLYDALKQEHSVFIDQAMLVGTKWAERIDSELENSDFIIILLSKKSINSEMVAYEIKKSNELAKRNGRPLILPIRVAFRDDLPYPISVYLDHINCAFWEDENDSRRLIDELLRVVSGGEPVLVEESRHEITQKEERKYDEPLPSAQPIQLEMPEGTMRTESQFYVERNGDHVALQAIAQQGVTITIKAPRQMGKSSLLNRVMSAARDADKHVAFLDFQFFDDSTMKDADTFFRQFCTYISDELEIEDRVDEYWQSAAGYTQKCLRYLQRHVLNTVTEPLLLAMDEVESIFDKDFRNDFFGMLRGWHNKRASSQVWSRLDLALVTSTEPYLFIENPYQSPFNVGVKIELSDFTLRHIETLNRLHDAPFTKDELAELTELLGGHPYLTRKALYLIASGAFMVKDFFKTAGHDDGPFGDNLRYYLFHLIDHEKLLHGLRQIIQNNTCQDERVFFRLRGAGLVHRENGKMKPRCKLYADYFGQHLDG